MLIQENKKNEFIKIIMVVKGILKENYMNFDFHQKYCDVISLLPFFITHIRRHTEDISVFDIGNVSC